MKKFIILPSLLLSISAAYAQPYSGPYDGYNTPVVRGDIWKRIPGLDSDGRLLLDNIGTRYVASVNVMQSGKYAYSDLPVTLTPTPQGSISNTNLSVDSYVVAGGVITTTPSNCVAGTQFLYTPANAKFTLNSDNTLTVVSSGSLAYSAIPNGSVQLTSSDPNCSAPLATLYWGVGSVSITDSGQGYTNAPTIQSSSATFTPANIKTTIQSKSISLDNMMENYVPLSQKGVASGVASLDDSGNVTASVQTYSTSKIGSNTPSAYSGGTVTIPKDFLFSVGDSKGFNILDDRSTLIGARGYASGSPTFINALPYGGSALGSVLSVGMTKAGIGGFQTALAPRGTDGSGGISSYPEMDAAATWFAADTSYPWVTAGADFVSNDGQAHSVTYDSTHAYFSPSLSATDVSLLRDGMHVMTNSVGSTRANGTNRWQPNNDYAGEVTDFASDGSSITVGGWRVLGSGNTDGTQIPGTTYDTKMWPTYTHPALFIGTYTHEIANNSMCFMEARTVQVKGDQNAPEVNTYPNPVNDCEIEEADLGTYLPDYMGKVKGILVTFNGPNKPTIDSYDFMAAGTMPFGYVAWNGSQNVNMISDGFMARGNNGVNGGTGTDGNVIAATTDTHEMAEFIGASAVQPNGDGSGDKLSLSIWQQVLTAATNMGANAGSNVAIHVGQLINGTTTDVSKPTAAETVDLTKRVGEVVYNVDGTGGIALHGGTSGLGIKVDSSGNTYLDGNIIVQNYHSVMFPTSTNSSGTYINVDANGNLSIGTQVSGGGGLNVSGKTTLSGGVSGNITTTTKGAQISLLPSNGDAISPFIYASDKATITGSNSEGDGIVLDFYGFTGQTVQAKSNLIEPFDTPATSTAACTQGQTEFDATYSYYCVATNTWKRTAHSTDTW